MLEVDKINVLYGETQVLWDITTDVKEAECVVIVGSNGSGKTTLIKTIAGLLEPRSGSIKFLGETISKSPPNKIVERGLVLLPSGSRIFTRMTVMENLEMGAYLPKAREKMKDSLKRVFEHFPILEERKSQKAGTMSGGERQMLAIGRCLMSCPKLLMLDEPSFGLGPIFVVKTFEVLNKIKNEGVAILMVEQNMRQALNMADRGYVLENGRITLSGTGRELSDNKYVKEAFLGL